MRSSNIEILRILSMVMIIMHHFSIYGAWPESGALSSDIAVYLLSFGGKLGVNCFVLITGYFMVSSRPKIQSVLRIALETWFYSYAILSIFLVVRPEIVASTQLIRALLPLCTGEYWFITCYIGMILTSPFLNALYHRLTCRGKTYLMALGFIVLSIAPTLSTYNPLDSNLVWFFYLYLLGGWVRELMEGRRDTTVEVETNSDAPKGTPPREGIILCPFDPLRLVRKLTPIGASLGGIVFVWASMAVITWAHNFTGFSLIGPKYFILQHTIPTFIASLGLLITFSQMRVSNLEFVNAMAKTTLGVYLIHDNPLVRTWFWPHVAWVYNLGPAAILAFGILSAIALFAAYGFIDWLRIVLLEKPLFALIDKYLGERLNETQKVLEALTKTN